MEEEYIGIRKGRRKSNVENKNGIVKVKVVRRKGLKYLIVSEKFTLKL